MQKAHFLKYYVCKNKLIFFLSIFLLFQSTYVNAQINKDSLFTVLKSPESADTLKLKTLSEIIKKVYLYNNPDSAFHFARIQYDFARKVNSSLYQSGALNWMGTCMYLKGDFTKAIEYYERSLNFDKNSNTPNVLNNIGLIYWNQGNYEKAKKYYIESLTLYNKNKEYKFLGTLYGNLGIIYFETGEYEKSLKYLDLALKSHGDFNNQQGIAEVIISKGVLMMKTSEYNQAIACFTTSMKIGKETNNLQVESYSLYNLGEISLLLNKKNNAKSYLLKSLQLAQKLESYEIISKSSRLLVDIYRNEAKYREAFNMYETYVSSRDSMQKLENTKALLELDFRVKAAADSVKNVEFQKLKEVELEAERAKNEILSIETKQKKQQSYFLYGGLIISLLFGGIIFNRFRLTREQKSIIESQKSVVDKAYVELAEKNKSITDSINYAKRIQAAILPSDKIIHNYIPQSFIFYKPKDIVAGDFYWIDKKQDIVMFAVADCTGHGVPGAMVSVVCNNALNKVFRESEVQEPGKMLDMVNEIVIEQFSKNDEDVSDGMDISLCALDLNNKTLSYSGANNPLYLVRSNELLVFNADRQPVGKYPERKPFKTHQIGIIENDIVYLFSDGFADQFGGKDGKKLKSKAFKELLVSISQKQLKEQNKILAEAFKNWKKSYEQVDDICVMGVKISLQ